MNKFSSLLGAFLLLILVGSAVSSCSWRARDFSIMSTKQVDITTKYVKKEIVEGSSMVPVILFPFGKPTYTEAVEDALTKSGGDFLTDVVVEGRSIGIIFLGAIGYRVRGDYWVKASGSDLEDANLSDLYELRETENGLAMVNVEDDSLVKLVVTEDNFEDLVEVKREY